MFLFCILPGTGDPAHLAAHCNPKPLMISRMSDSSFAPSALCAEGANRRLALTHLSLSRRSSATYRQMKFCSKVVNASGPKSLMDRWVDEIGGSGAVLGDGPRMAISMTLISGGRMRF